MSILIVDDTRSMRALMEYHLRGDGFENILHAASAAEALDMLRPDQSEGIPPEVELILMDRLLPGMDGIEAVVRIKADPRLTAIPILVVTSDLSADIVGAARKAGAEGFIPKPLDKHIFLKRVRETLNRAANRASDIP